MDIFVGQLRKWKSDIHLFVITNIDTTRITAKVVQYDDPNTGVIITIKYLDDGFQTNWSLDHILRDTVPYEA